MNSIAAPCPPLRRKVAVVGAGAVGSDFAFALAQSGAAEEIVLTDLNADLAEGQALDLAHGAPFYPSVLIHARPAPEAYRDAAVVVVTAGKAQSGASQSRLELLRVNARIVTSIARDIYSVNPSAVVVIVSNPVDVLTHIAADAVPFPPGRLFGSGTVLDSARLRWMLSAHCGVSPQHVHASMLGEHGDSEFAAWSLAHLAGIPMADFCRSCGKCDSAARRGEFQTAVRRSAYHIIGYKGSTSYGVGMALCRIVGAVLRDERRILTVSARLSGEFSLSGVTLGVPCIVGANGVERVLDTPLPPAELDLLRASARILRESIDSLSVN